MCGCCGELPLDFWRCRTSTVRIDFVLSFGCEVLSISLNSLSSIPSVLDCNILDLSSLLVDQVITLLNLMINELLVLDVDKRTEKGNGGCNQSQSPKWDELYKKVRDQGRKKGLYVGEYQQLRSQL